MAQASAVTAPPPGAEYLPARAVEPGGDLRKVLDPDDLTRAVEADQRVPRQQVPTAARQLEPMAPDYTDVRAWELAPAGESPEAAPEAVVSGPATARDLWLRCSACKTDIPFRATHWVCSVSTCNRKRTGLTFCGLSCFEAHLPTARHRDAWAESQRAPSRAEWEAAHALVPATAGKEAEVGRKGGGI